MFCRIGMSVKPVNTSMSMTINPLISSSGSQDEKRFDFRISFLAFLFPLNTEKKRNPNILNKKINQVRSLLSLFPCDCIDPGWNPFLSLASVPFGVCCAGCWKDAPGTPTDDEENSDRASDDGGEDDDIGWDTEPGPSSYSK